MHRLALPAVSALVAVLLVGPAHAETFESFLSAASRLCLHRPAATCLDSWFRFVDRDDDGALSRSEFAHFHTQWRRWGETHLERLPSPDRQLLATLLLAYNWLGVGYLFDAYDEDRNRRIDRSEAFSDLKLDRRPLPQLLQDPDAIDEAALERHFGPVAPVLRELLASLR